MKTNSKLYLILLLIFNEIALAQSPVDSLEIINPFTRADDIRKIINEHFSILGEENKVLIKQFDRQIEIARKQNSILDENNALINSGDIYFRAGLYNSALEKYFLALNNYEMINDTLNAAFAQIKIGRAYYYSDLSPGKDYTKLGCNILKDSEDVELEAFAYYAQGSVEEDTVMKNMMYKKALDIQLEVIKKKPDDYTANENFSRYLNAIGKLDEALTVAEKIGNKWLEVLYLNNIGFRMVKEGKYSESLKIFFRSLSICKEARLKTLLRNTYDNIARAYRLMNNWEKSAVYQQLMHHVEESLYTEQYTLQASEFRVKYETERKELENDFLKKEKDILADNIRIEKNQNLLLIFSLGIISLISVYIFFSRRKIKKANNLLDKQNAEILLQKEELKKSEENLKVAQSTAHLANWEWDFNTDELIFSDEFPNIYDVDKKKLKDNFREVLIEIIHPEDRGQFIDIFKKKVNMIDSEEREYRIIKNGEIKWLRTKRIALKDSAGNVTKIFGTVQDITGSKEKEEIKIKIAAQQSFTKQLIESQEEERKRIAGELHDSIGQDILLIKNRALLGLQSENIDEMILEQLNAISDSASLMLRVVREISFDLRPAHLERLGLTDTIISAIQHISEATKIKINHNIENIDGLFGGEKEIYLFRIIQEGINNIIKHSDAKNAYIEIHKRNGSISLNIVDDGKGFEIKTHIENPAGFGLNNILNRVKILNGNLKIISETAKGTRLEITMPVENDE